MMRHHYEQRESQYVPNQAVKAAKSERPHLRIEICDEDGGKLWRVISDNNWQGEYLGKNTFVFSSEQLAKIQEAGVRFRVLD
jgi:hypothetical protein